MPRLRVPHVSATRVRRFGRDMRGRLPRLPRVRGIIGPADLLTLTNGLMGFLVIAVVTGVANLYEPPFFTGLAKTFPGLAGDDKFLLAAILLVIAAISDAMDGIVARKFGGSNLGADLDTISDTISFVVAPAVMIYVRYGGGEDLPFRALLVAALFMVMGMLRLARFNANPTESNTVTFEGLPTPWAAAIVTLIILVNVRAIFALPTIAVLAFLMMSSVAYPKSRGKVVYVALAMAVAMVATIVVILFFPDDQPRVLRGTLTFALLAVAILPLMLARSGRTRRGGS